MFEFRLRFHKGSNQTTPALVLDDGLAPTRRQSNIRTTDGQFTDAFMHHSAFEELWRFCLICAWTNSWVNNREAGDLRRQRGHYDVIAMVPKLNKRKIGV